MQPFILVNCFISEGIKKLSQKFNSQGDFIMKKKILSIILGGVLSASMLLSVSADDNVKCIVSTYDDVKYTVSVNNNSLLLGESEIYVSKKGGNIMVPLRKTAEALSFDVEWNKDNKSAKLDNGSINTTVYIGNDSYYMASSTAIGMSAPTSLGAAPEIINDVAYVPTDLFEILFCTVEYDGNNVYINPETEKEEIPNPFIPYEDMESVKKVLDFEPVIPSYIPDGYEMKEITSTGSDFLQIIYTNDIDNSIYYRMAVGSEDISGDYNIYKINKDAKIGDITAQIHGNDKIRNAVWTDSKYTFSIFTDVELDETQIIKIIENIK